MATNATLNIVVQEKGSRTASANFKDMTQEIAKAGKALGNLKKKMNDLMSGGGAGGGGGGNTMARRVDKMIRAQDKVRIAMQKRADAVIKQFAREDAAAMRHAAAMARRVDRLVSQQDKIKAAMARRADSIIKSFAREDAASARAKAARAKRVDAAVREQDRIRNAMKKRADSVIKEFAREDAARAKSKTDMARRVDAVIRQQDRVRGAMKRRADGVVREFSREDAALKKVAAAHLRSSGAAKANAVATASSGAAARVATGSFVGLANQVFFLQRAFITLGGAFAVRGFLVASDEFQNMENRLGRVTTSAEEMNDTFKSMQAVARETRQDLGATVETFVRIRKATAAQGVSAEQVTKTLRTLNKMLAISGTTSQESEQAIRQLSQAFSKGKLDGDEFRTVSEAMPDILDAISESTGKTRGELRKMARQGKLTNDVLLDAFDAVEKTVDAEFDKSIKTLGQSWTVLKNAVVVAIGEFNKTFLIAKGLGGAIRFLADNMWILVAATQALVLWLGFKLGKVAIAAAVAGFGRLVAVIASVRKAMLAATLAFAISSGPIGAVVVGLGLLATAAAVATGALEDVGNAIGEALAPDNGVTISEMQEKLQFQQLLLQMAKEIRAEAIADGKDHRDIVKINRSIAAIKDKINIMQLTIDADARRRKAAEEAIEAEKRAAEEVERLTKNYAQLVKQLFPARTATEKYKDDVNTLVFAFQELDASLLDTIAGIGALTKAWLTAGNPVDAYNKKLDQSIEFEKKSTKAKRRATAVAKVQAFADKQRAEAIAQGSAAFEELVQKEIKLARLRERSKKKEKRDTLAGEFQEILDKLQPLKAVTREYSQEIAVLEKVLGKSAETTARKKELSKALRKELQANIDPIGAMTDALNQQLAASELDSASRERRLAFLEKEKTIREALGQLGFDQAKDVPQRIEDQLDIEEQIKANKQQADFARDFRLQLQAGEIAAAQYREKMKILNEELDKNGDINKFNEERMKAQIALNPELASRIDALRQKYSNTALAAKDFEDQIKAIHAAQLAGVISREAANDALQEAGTRYRELGTDMVGVRMGLDELQQQFFSQQAVNQQIATTMINAYTGVEDAIVSLVTTGKFSFKDLIDSMLADVTRLLIRMTILKALQDSLTEDKPVSTGKVNADALQVFAKLAGASFRHGGSFSVGQQLPRFEHGGEFQVGGRGAPDSKLVQFLASPGENVSITNPGQSRLDNRNAAAQAAPPDVNITNIVDPAEFSAALASPAGQRVIINTVQQNADLLKKFMK